MHRPTFSHPETKFIPLDVSCIALFTKRAKFRYDEKFDYSL